MDAGYNLIAMKNKLNLFNISVFLQTQIFMLPFLLLFYQKYGLTVGDFFLFQGVFSISALLFEIPTGYLGDIFPKRNVLILSCSFMIARLLLWLFFAQYGYWVLLLGEILFAAHRASFAGNSDSYIYEYLKHFNVPNEMVARYGKMNFWASFGTAFSSFIAAYIYKFASEYSSAKYNANYGFTTLIILELILTLIALFLLFNLPKLPSEQNREHIGEKIKKSYKNLFNCITYIMKNENIRHHILYSGLLAAITAVFVWSFQPTMKLLLFPIALYGLVYFFNPAFRAMAGLWANKIKQLIPLSKLALLLGILFVICFILTFIILNVPSVPVYISLLYFVFVSLAVGLQLAFLMIHISRLHNFIPSEMRATLSSANTAVSRIYSGVFFILMKILLDGFPIQKSILICFIIFLIALVPLKNVYKISKQEELSV